MQYDNSYRATFLSRPNRFIANVLLDGKPEVVHVKNTGRCRELLRSDCCGKGSAPHQYGRPGAQSCLCRVGGRRRVSEGADFTAPRDYLGEF